MTLTACYWKTCRFSLQSTVELPAAAQSRVWAGDRRSEGFPPASSSGSPLSSQTMKKVFTAAQGRCRSDGRTRPSGLARRPGAVRLPPPSGAAGYGCQARGSAVPSICISVTKRAAIAGARWLSMGCSRRAPIGRTWYAGDSRPRARTFATIIGPSLMMKVPADSR